MNLQNIFKGWITTTLGTIAIAIALYLIAVDKIVIWPNACIIFFVGGLLLLAPDKFSGIVDTVQGIAKKKTE